MRNIRRLNSKNKLALFIVVGAVGFMSLHFARAYTGSNFTGTVSSLAYDVGTSNVLLGELTGPTPATDTVAHDGASNAVAAGNTLSAFASTNKFLDMDADETYDDGEAIVSSANAVLDSVDTVITAATSVLTSFAASETVGTVGYLDQTVSSSLSAGEDIVRLVHSGEGAALTSGDSITTFPLADSNGEWSNFFFAIGDQTDFDTVNPQAIIAYSFSDIEMGNTLNIISGGTVGFTTVDSGDPICIADLDSDGIMNPVADIFWWDAAGTCATFNTGTDVVISNNSHLPFSGTNRFLSEITPPGFFGPISIGYSDGNNNGQYTCSRGGACEAIIFLGGSYSYATGTAVTPGQLFGAIYGEKDDLVDGVNAVSHYPTELPLEAGVNVKLMDQVTINGENSYAFVDSDSDGTFDDNEDVLQIIRTGSAGAVATGDDFTYFTSGVKYIDSDDGSTYDADEAIVSSANANLDVGALNGSGTDRVFYGNTSNDLMSFSGTVAYYDHDSSGSYADGDDIVNDIDGSLLYRADDLQTIKFTNSVTDYPVGDDDLDNLFVYKRVGGSCVGAGTDTLLGSIASSPFFNTNITITDSPFTSAAHYCVYADSLAGADPGEYITLRIPSAGAAYASGNSPSDGVRTFTGGYIGFTKAMSSVLTPASLVGSANTTYTFAFTNEAGLTTGDNIRLLFPSGYNVASATVACTDDSVATDGTSGISSQAVIFTLTDAIGSSSDIECIVSGVRNPSTAGDYASGFGLFTNRDAIGGTISAEYDDTFDAVLITKASSGGRGTGSTPAPVTPRLTITKPNIEVISSGSVDIEWNTVGADSDYVNIAYELNGDRHEIAHNASNMGSYTWASPALLAGETVTLIVESTDLSSVTASDSVIIAFAGDIPQEDPQVPSDSSCDAYETPDLSKHLVKGPVSPTVYYLAPDNMLRPFFTEALFKTWGLSFNDVRVLSQSEIERYVLGSPMAPLPGTVLVKSPLDAKVYALEPNPENPARPYLHWVKNEEVANAYFGTAWASRIIDVAPSIIVMSPVGDDLTDPDNAPCFIGLY